MPEPYKTNPIRETTDEARALARSLIENAQFAAIGVLEPEPDIRRFRGLPSEWKRTARRSFLASDLSGHSKALAERRAGLAVMR